MKGSENYFGLVFKFGDSVCPDWKFSLRTTMVELAVKNNYPVLI
jgi:hypothetical protein